MIRIITVIIKNCIIPQQSFVLQYEILEFRYPKRTIPTVIQILHRELKTVTDTSVTYLHLFCKVISSLPCKSRLCHNWNSFHFQLMSNQVQKFL